MAKVSTHAKMSTLSYLLTALAHLKADDYESMRHMTNRLPQARSQAVDWPELHECGNCCICPEHNRLAA